MSSFEIDRKEIFSKEIYEPIFNRVPPNHAWFSIVGMTGVGKTTLSKQWENKFSQKKLSNVFCIRYVLPGCPESESCFWRMLFRKIFDKISSDAIKQLQNYSSNSAEKLKEIEKIRDFFTNSDHANEIGTPKYMDDENEYLENIWHYLKELDIHVILIIDECDKLKGFGNILERFFAWSKKGGTNYNLSCIFISRKNLDTIFDHYHTGAFSKKVLYGFSDKELDEYFESYSEKIPEEERQELCSICGRHPQLLMIFRDRWNSKEDSENIRDIIDKGNIEIIDNYERITNLMKSDDIPLNSISVFDQLFIGRPYEDKNQLMTSIERMAALGFIRKFGKEQNVFQLAGEKFVSYGLTLGYEPISRGFVNYIKYDVLPHDVDGLVNKVENTRVDIFNAIDVILKNKFVDYEDKEKTFISNLNKEKYTCRQDALAAKFYCQERGVDYSPLATLAFLDLSTLISDYWSIMSERFFIYRESDGSVSKQLKQDFLSISDFRDPQAAHRSNKTGDFVSLEHQDKVRKICEKLQKCLANKIVEEKTAVQMVSGAQLGFVSFYNKTQDAAHINPYYSHKDSCVGIPICAFFKPSAIKIHNFFQDQVLLVSYITNGTFEFHKGKNIETIDPGSFKILDVFDKKSGEEEIWYIDADTAHSVIVTQKMIPR